MMGLVLVGVDYNVLRIGRRVDVSKVSEVGELFLLLRTGVVVGRFSMAVSVVGVDEFFKSFVGLSVVVVVECAASYHTKIA